MKVFLKKTKIKISVMILTATLLFWFIPSNLIFASVCSNQDNVTTLQSVQSSQNLLSLSTGSDVSDGSTLRQANQTQQQILSLSNSDSSDGNVSEQTDQQILSNDSSLDESTASDNQNSQVSNDDAAGLDQTTGSNLQNTQTRLSTGLRINSAADDAAGLNTDQNEISAIDTVSGPKFTSQTQKSQVNNSTVKQDSTKDNDSSIITETPENTITVAALQNSEIQKVQVLAYTGLAPVVPITGTAVVLIGAIFIILSLTGNNKKWKHAWTKGNFTES